MLSESRRAYPKVKSYIVDRTRRTVHEFRVIVRRQLKVHSAQDVSVRGGVETFLKLSLKSVRFKKGVLYGLHEVTSAIVQDRQLQDEAACKFRLGKTDLPRLWMRSVVDH